MIKRLSVTVLAIGLGACGGSDSSNPTPTPAPPGGNADNAYLSYMKTAYGDQLGENAENNTHSVRESNAPDASPAPAPTLNDASDNFSGTNVQIIGVDEANALKFDGQNLLSLNRQSNYTWWQEDASFQPTVRLFSEAVLAGESEVNSSLHFEPSADYKYNGLLSYDEQTVLIGSQDYWYGRLPVEPFVTTDIACTEGCGGQSQVSKVIAYTWEYAQEGIALAPQPEEILIEGSLVESRLIENKLYIISRYNPYIPLPVPFPITEDEREQNQRAIDELTLAEVAPSIEINGQSELLFDGKDCQIKIQSDGYFNYPNVISITEIDINAPTDWRSTCYVGDVSSTFVSSNAVYLSQWVWAENEVEITKYSFTEAGIEHSATGKVKGSLSYDNYYFGEVDGKLAYVNTLYDGDWWDSTAKHQLTVFEQNGDQLDILAQIPNEEEPAPIGKPGEQIYAVRFMNERAYIVTFDQIDPLYVVDLSEPSEPSILGELEIPGFSSYIHVINDDLILGVGKNAVSAGDITYPQGINIRLFDVSEPNAPQVIQSLDYGLRGSESEVFFTPHAFSFVNDTENNIFRFTLPMELHGDAEGVNPNAHPSTYYDWNEGGLFQFEVDTGNTPSITEVGRFIRENQSEPFWYYRSDDRSVINNNLIYYAHDEKLDVLEWGGASALRSFENN